MIELLPTGILRGTTITILHHSRFFFFLSSVGHAESYNPPPEFLPTKEEAEQWKAAHPEDRRRDFLPTKWVVDDSIHHEVFLLCPQRNFFFFGRLYHLSLSTDLTASDMYQPTRTLWRSASAAASTYIFVLERVASERYGGDSRFDVALAVMPWYVGARKAM